MTLKNVWFFNQGWFRYWLYYRPRLKFLIRERIREQIDMRINSMNQQCYNSGSCIKCGCATTALQMADKPCEGECYPRMMDKIEWKVFKKVGFLYIDCEVWCKDVDNNKFILMSNGKENCSENCHHKEGDR